MPPAKKILPKSLILTHITTFALMAVGLDPLLAQPGSPAIYAAVWQVYNKKKSGTAFAIDSPKRNRFVTNAHTIMDSFKPNGGSISLSQKDSKFSLQFHRLIAISTTYDLVLFETKESVHHYLRFARKFDKDKAESLYIVGYPQESFKLFRQTAKIAYEDDFSYEFAVNKMGHATIGFGGMSGAPVLNARDKVVMIQFWSNKNLVGGIKGELAQRLITGDQRAGVICSVQERARDCLARAIEQTAIMANQGNSAAQYHLSRDRYIHTGELAKAWRFMAAKNDSPRAQQSLGFEYHRMQDFKNALHWFEMAAESDLSSAIFQVGYYFYKGVNYGVAQNYSKAFALFRQSARSGYNLAQFCVGVMLHYGLGTAMDRDGAKHWIEKAATTGLVVPKKFLKQNC